MWSLRPTVALCVWLAASPAGAQQPTGTIEGLVAGLTGMPLGRATVTARSPSIGVQRETVTDADGRYLLTGLAPAGDYEIRAQRSGFAVGVREPVALAGGQSLVIDFALMVTASETVAVGATALAVDLTRADVDQVIADPLAHSLPLLGRGFIQIASLAAGFTGNPDFPNAQGQFYWTTNVLVDGASDFSKWRSAPRSFYSGYGLEAIGQVRVFTNQFSASVGQALSSVTSAVTRAGTDNWHGSALLFVRDDALDATPAFALRTPPSSGQQFGFGLGGPIVLSRTHLFTNYEGRRARDRSIVMSPVARGAEAPDRQDEHLVFARIDHQATERQLLTTRYNGQMFRWHHEPGGLTLPGSGTSYTNDVHTLLVTHTLLVPTDRLNQFRVQFARYVDIRTDLQPSVFISRAGYSISGGALGPDGFSANPEGTWEAADTFSHLHGRHSFEAGGTVSDVRAHTTALAYGHGAYFFAGAPDLYPQPFLFVQAFAPVSSGVAADPRSLMASGFAQDDWKIHSALTLNAGLRYDVERVSNVRNYSVPTDANNIQPRVGLAWDPGHGGHTVVRGGVGVYTQQLLLYPITRVQLEGTDGAITLALTPASPLFPVPPASLPALVPGTPFPARDVYRVDRTFRNPYSVQASVGVQQLFGATVIGADYVHLSGHDLMSVVDANAPASLEKPGARTVAEADASRSIVPAPTTFRDLLTLGNRGLSWYRALQIKVNRPAGRVQTIASYTLSRAEDMANAQLPEDSRNIGAEKGRASTDVRHNVSGGFTWELPGTGARGGWSLAGIGIVRSNRPYTITWGDDRNGTTQNDARPGARNTGRTGPYRTVDLSLSKRVHRARTTIEGRIEAFNVFNATNYDQYVGELLSPLFSRPVSAFPPRQLQLAAIVRF
jgi:hypothetical protein